MFFPKIDDSYCDRIHSSLTTVHCFDNGYVGKQPATLEEYCAGYWLKEVLESICIDRYTGLGDINEILLKMGLNTFTIIVRVRLLQYFLFKKSMILREQKMS